MTARRIPYAPVQDIPNLDKRVLSSRKTDKQMRDLLDSTRFCLKHPSNLKKPTAFGLAISEIITNQLHMFSITHFSIREIVKAAIRSELYPIVTDALSLAREQVEKVFIIATLMDNPNEGFKRYWRSSWKARYEQYLLDQEEHKDNERFDGFLSKNTPKQLEKMRSDPVRNNILISKYAERLLVYHWNNPFGKNPSWFRMPKSNQKPKNVFNYIRDYFEFATPGRGTKRIKDPELRRFLFRWHKEYVALSQYTHVTKRKIAFAEMLKDKSMASHEPMKNYAINHATTAVNTSYTAAATACLLVVNGISQNYGAKRATRQFWETLIGFSLLSKGLWAMYAEAQLD
jgi:hypothetical protein